MGSIQFNPKIKPFYTIHFIQRSFFLFLCFSHCTIFVRIWIQWATLTGIFRYDVKHGRVSSEITLNEYDEPFENSVWSLRQCFPSERILSCSNSFILFLGHWIQIRENERTHTQLNNKHYGKSARYPTLFIDQSDAISRNARYGTFNLIFSKIWPHAFGLKIDLKFMQRIRWLLAATEDETWFSFSNKVHSIQWKIKLLREYDVLLCFLYTHTQNPNKKFRSSLFRER